jgi:DeoR/GlpR family transcriptional regulator of sugar metabolism
MLASSCRQKILKELSKSQEIRVMKLVRQINSTYNEVNRNLKILETEGIIINDYRQRVKHGKVRVLQLNRENPRTRILLQVLETLEVENDVVSTN